MRTPNRYVLLLTCVLANSSFLGANEGLRRHENRLPAWMEGDLGVVELPTPKRRWSEDEYYAAVYEALGGSSPRETP